MKSTTSESGQGDPHLRAYLGVVERVTALVREAEPSALDATVSACPDWTARNVLSHLAGLAEDWVSGNLDNYGSEAWAQAQAERFVERPIEDALEAWHQASRVFGELGPSPLGATPARWAFGDAVTHEADLRPVLAPGTRPPNGPVAMAAQAAVGRWRVELTNAEAPPLDIVATDMRTWQVGDAEARGAHAADSVTTTGYEVFRALYGRRSQAQVAAWDWTCDPAPYLDAGLPFPFSWPATDQHD